ncbi:hypothetical protein [Kangiella marina]|uniref:hypothetical protein n=1 Tax=Kangiella marina TaxID=1079178 RepID=UPI0031EC738E
MISETETNKVYYYIGARSVVRFKTDGTIRAAQSSGSGFFHEASLFKVGENEYHYFKTTHQGAWLRLTVSNEDNFTLEKLSDKRQSVFSAFHPILLSDEPYIKHEFLHHNGLQKSIFLAADSSVEVTVPFTGYIKINHYMDLTGAIRNGKSRQDYLLNIKTNALLDDYYYTAEWDYRRHFQHKRFSQSHSTLLKVESGDILTLSASQSIFVNFDSLSTEDYLHTSNYMTSYIDDLLDEQERLQHLILSYNELSFRNELTGEIEAFTERYPLSSLSAIKDGTFYKTYSPLDSTNLSFKDAYSARQERVERGYDQKLNNPIIVEPENYHDFYTRKRFYELDNTITYENVDSKKSQLKLDLLTPESFETNAIIDIQAGRGKTLKLTFDPLFKKFSKAPLLINESDVDQDTTANFTSEYLTLPIGKTEAYSIKSNVENLFADLSVLESKKSLDTTEQLSRDSLSIDCFIATYNNNKLGVQSYQSNECQSAESYYQHLSRFYTAEDDFETKYYNPDYKANVSAREVLDKLKQLNEPSFSLQRDYLMYFVVNNAKEALSEDLLTTLYDSLIDDENYYNGLAVAQYLFIKKPKKSTLLELVKYYYLTHQFENALFFAGLNTLQIQHTNISQVTLNNYCEVYRDYLSTSECEAKYKVEELFKNTDGEITPPMYAHYYEYPYALGDTKVAHSIENDIYRQYYSLKANIATKIPVNNPGHYRIKIAQIYTEDSDVDARQTLKVHLGDTELDVPLSSFPSQNWTLGNSVYIGTHDFVYLQVSEDSLEIEFESSNDMVFVLERYLAPDSNSMLSSEPLALYTKLYQNWNKAIKGHIDSAKEIMSVVSQTQNRAIKRFESYLMDYYDWLEVPDLSTGDMLIIPTTDYLPKSKRGQSLLALSDTKIPRYYLSNQSRLAINLSRYDIGKTLRFSAYIPQLYKNMRQDIAILYQTGNGKVREVALNPKQNKANFTITSHSAELKLWLKPSVDVSDVFLQIENLDNRTEQRFYQSNDVIDYIRNYPGNIYKLVEYSDGTTLVKYGLNRSQLNLNSSRYYKLYELTYTGHIDNRYTGKYGDYLYDPNKQLFSDETKLVDMVAELPLTVDRSAGLYYQDLSLETGTQGTLDQESSFSDLESFQAVKYRLRHREDDNQYQGLNLGLYHSSDYQALNSKLLYDDHSREDYFYKLFSLSGWYYNSDFGGSFIFSGEATLGKNYDYNDWAAFNSELSLVYRKNFNQINDPRNDYPTFVWSDYKQNHDKQISFSSELVLKPYVDFHTFAGVGVKSNADLFSVDQFSTQLGLRGKINAFYYSTRIRNKLYFSDDFRAEQFSSSQLQVNLDWNIYQTQENMLTLYADYVRDIEDKSDYFYLGIRYSDHQGNYLNALRPSEKVFSGISTYDFLQRN